MNSTSTDMLRKYTFMIMDFKKKYIIDMYKIYKLICNVFFKNTTICVDPFHAIKKVNDSLNTLRKRIMRTYKDN